MTTATAPTSAPAPTPAPAAFQQPKRSTLILRYLRRNKSLTTGLLIVLFLALFTVIGLLTVDTKKAYPLAVRTKQPPSAQFPLGTDLFGRDLLAAMVVGLWQTVVIGVIAGAIGTLLASSWDSWPPISVVPPMRHSRHHGNPAYPSRVSDIGHHRRLAR